MRVVRTLLGILLLTVAVITSVAGGALWIATGHEGSGGTFGAVATGVTSPGHAIVVTDVDAFLRSDAPFARAARTSVTVDGMTPTGPAFIGLAPLAAVRTYLGPASYGTVTGIHLGLGGPVPVTVSTPAVPNPAAVPGGAPGTQRFWVASGLGSLTWAPADRTGLALVVMRADAAAGVTVTAHVAVRPGWLGRTALALFAVALLAALCAIVLLLWPARRREIVYVVEPAQLPEIAERLGVTGSFPVIQTGVRFMPAEEPVVAAPPPPVAAADPLTSAVREADLLPAVLADPWDGLTREGAWAEPFPLSILGDAVASRPPATDHVAPTVDTSRRPVTLADFVGAADLGVAGAGGVLAARPVTLADFAGLADPGVAAGDGVLAACPATLADFAGLADPGVVAAGGVLAARPATLADFAGLADPGGVSAGDVLAARSATAADVTASAASRMQLADVRLSLPVAAPVGWPVAPAGVVPGRAGEPGDATPHVGDADAHPDNFGSADLRAHNGRFVGSADARNAGRHSAIHRPAAPVEDAEPVPVAGNVGAHPSMSGPILPTQAGGRRSVARLRRLRVVESVPEAVPGTPSVPFGDDPWTAPSSRARGPRHAAPDPGPATPPADVVAELVERVLSDAAMSAATSRPAEMPAVVPAVIPAVRPGGDSHGVPPVPVAYSD